MSINLSILDHQTECLARVSEVFEGVRLERLRDNYANPVFNAEDEKIKENIKEIQNRIDSGIPLSIQTSADDHFGIDVRMETGTGKTYCYTRLMYELNKRYGFHKFIILVPTTPIKEGTKSFISSDYAKKHFADLYTDKKVYLSVLDPQKNKKGRKMFPQAISDFLRGSALEKNRISTLLMSSGMLLSKATMEKDYDQTLLGLYTNPYESLKAVRPIVIIDEPHKFKKENTAYKKLLEKINPLCVIRFGATFPNLPKSDQKDYNNLVFNLGSCESFNRNLVKGVATQMIQQESANETKVKLMEIVNSPKSCVFRNEKTKKSYTLAVDDSLSSVDPEFSGITVSAIGKTDDEDIKKGVTLSNGQIIVKGDQIYAGIYSNTYQDLMMKQAIKNHIEQERENFYKRVKIKTLSLFFIDSIYSYRGEEGDGPLRISFQKLLKEELQKELEECKKGTKEIDRQYASFIEASLKDISGTNGGYFAEDNSSSDEDIKKEVDQILRDKESLLSFVDEKGQWNIRRFIFSKWTLREGWDNPNVFQICKLRSSGSEISKLQEVGRGLRLPVDERGNRVSDETFYLTYLYDYSEKDFAKNLMKEINNDSVGVSLNIKEKIKEVAAARGIKETELLVALLSEEFVDMDYNIKLENKDEFISQYPEFRMGLEPNKIIDKNDKTKGFVKIRKDQFAKIRELWKTINQKYYLSLDEMSDDELYDGVLEILNSDIRGTVYATTVEQRIVNENGNLVTKESIVNQQELSDYMAYGEFLKQIHSATGIPLKITHKALCEYNKSTVLDQSFFNRNTLTNIIKKFQEWFETQFATRYSYKSLDVNSLETALTDVNGDPKENIVQGVVGVMKDSSVKVPEKFLFDTVVYDSPKERENIQNSNSIDEVVVFGKIPRRSVQVPLYFGGTTSPDFMYVIKKDDKTEINFIIETKDIAKGSNLREDEKRRIASAKKFFETLKADGVAISFKEQIKNDEVYTMIRDLMK